MKKKYLFCYILIILSSTLIDCGSGGKGNTSENDYSIPVLNDLIIKSSSSVSIELQQPIFSVQGFPTPEVKAYIGVDGDISVSGKDVSNYIEQNIDNYQFNNLNSYTSYRIIVVAENIEGYSVKQIVQSTSAIAPVMNDLAIESFDTGSITIAQPTFSTAGNPAPNVLAYIGIDGTISVSGTVVSNYIEGNIDVSSGSYQFSNLNSEVEYKIIVIASNLKGYTVKDIIQATALISPIYHIPCNEGTGTTIAETVNGIMLNSVVGNIAWCRGNIKGYTDRWYIKSGANSYSTGVITGNVINEDLPQYTLSFLTRIPESGNGGAVVRFFGDLHFRFWYSTWDLAGGVSANINDVKLNTWMRVSFVQTDIEQYVYIDDTLSGQADGITSIPAGMIRVGAFEDTDWMYPGEYTDIRIYDYAMTQQQISRLCQSDGSNSQFVIYGTGSDFGGFWKREEHDGEGESSLSIADDMYMHLFNGSSCWGVLSVLIPAGYPSLWFSADFIYPENLDANHDLGDTVHTIGLYGSYDRYNPVAVLYLKHEIIDNGAEKSRLTLYQLSYRNTANGITNVDLDESEIIKGQKYHFEIQYTQGESGSISFYINDEELHSSAGNFDIPIVQAMFGLNLGIHPQNDGNIIYSDNLYVGQLRLTDFLNK